MTQNIREKSSTKYINLKINDPKNRKNHQLNKYINLKINENTDKFKSHKI